MAENKRLLTKKEKAKVFKPYPCLDSSFEEGFETEVEMVLEAQAKLTKQETLKAVNLILIEHGLTIDIEKGILLEIEKDA